MVLTISEKEDANLPSNFLFVFTHEQEKTVIKQYLTREYTSIRFDLFSIVEGTTVTFDPIGDWRYKVYQMPNGGSTDESLGNLLELGKIRVIDVSESIIAPIIDNTIIAYGS